MRKKGGGWGWGVGSRKALRGQRKVPNGACGDLDLEKDSEGIS